MDEKIESNSTDTDNETKTKAEINEEHTLKVVIPKLKVTKKKKSE